MSSEESEVSIANDTSATREAKGLAKLKEAYNENKKRKFKPIRRGPIPNWQKDSRFSQKQLDEGRKLTIKKLEELSTMYNGVVKELVEYLVEIIKIAVPGDNLYLVLLHCALQWSRNHITFMRE